MIIIYCLICNIYDNITTDIGTYMSYITFPYGNNSGSIFYNYKGTFSIDPFSVSKHCDVFLWAELSWRQKDSTDHFTNASYEVC